MNKKNKILVGCLVLLLVLSVGYALFSQTITINGTATAKGDFNITTTCVKGISSETGLDAEALGLNPENGYENDSCSVVGNDVSFTTNLNYPGAARYFTIKATNTGSIPATIRLLDNDVTDLAIFKDASLNICPINEDGSIGSCSQRLTDDTNSYNPLEVAIAGMSDANGFYSADSDEIMNFIDENTGNLILESGESVYIAIGYEWSSDYKNSTNSANYTFDFAAEIPFEQLTQ